MMQTRQDDALSHLAGVKVTDEGVLKPDELADIEREQDALHDRIRRFAPDHVHISTEGPLGLLVRRYCRLRGWRFSTSYHTRFPEYLKQLARVPLRWSYRFLKWFHNGSSCMMVATPSLERELIGRGFTAPIRRWSRGVDLGIFHPRPRSANTEIGRAHV